MKKVAVFLITALVCWTSYYDIKSGTLDISSSKAATTAKATEQEKTADSNKIPYKKIKVNPGDTVLSVVERLNPKTDLIISKVIKDFGSLNPDADPNHIKIGSSYLFPVY